MRRLPPIGTHRTGFPVIRSRQNQSLLSLETIVLVSILPRTRPQTKVPFSLDRVLMPWTYWTFTISVKGLELSDIGGIISPTRWSLSSSDYDAHRDQNGSERYLLHVRRLSIRHHGFQQIPLRPLLTGRPGIPPRPPHRWGCLRTMPCDRYRQGPPGPRRSARARASGSPDGRSTRPGVCACSCMIRRGHGPGA